MVGSAKRSSTALFSDPKDHLSHRVRLVLSEKNVGIEIISTDPQRLPQEVRDANPLNTLPTLLDRELTLYEPKVLMEYLDERFPHPPLLSVYPVARAETRQFIHRLDSEWGSFVDSLQQGRNKEQQAIARKNLAEGLISIAPIFGEYRYFMSNEFSLLDCCLAPVLWRLPYWGIEIPHSRQTKSLLEYQQGVFSRESFRQSLSDWEKGINTI